MPSKLSSLMGQGFSSHLFCKTAVDYAIVHLTHLIFESLVPFFIEKYLSSTKNSFEILWDAYNSLFILSVIITAIMGLKHIWFFYIVAKLIQKNKVAWFIPFLMIIIDLIIPKVEIRSLYGNRFFMLNFPFAFFYPSQAGSVLLY